MNFNFFDLEKRKKRDILAELLKNHSSDGLVSKKELYALNTLLDDSQREKTDLKQGRKSKTLPKPAAEKQIRRSPTKETCYLSQKTYDRLDKAETAIRKLVPEEQQAVITKSYIVNQALDIILQEFKTQGKNSRIMHNIMQKK